MIEINKESLPKINKINEVITSSRDITSNNTYHLTIVKVVFNCLLRDKLISDTMSEVERLNVINNKMDEVCECIFLDRTKLKAMIMRKMNHHFKKEMDAYNINTLADMSADYGDIDKNLPVGDIVKNLYYILTVKG